MKKMYRASFLRNARGKMRDISVAGMRRSGTGTIVAKGLLLVSWTKVRSPNTSRPNFM